MTKFDAGSFKLDRHDTAKSFAVIPHNLKVIGDRLGVDFEANSTSKRLEAWKKMALRANFTLESREGALMVTSTMMFHRAGFNKSSSELLGELTARSFHMQLRNPSIKMSTAVKAVYGEMMQKFGKGFDDYILINSVHDMCIKYQTIRNIAKAAK